MSDEPKAELQFDRADFEGAAKANAPCASCRQSVWGQYYSVNGHVLCDRCKAELDRRTQEGSGVTGFLRAALYGLGAGAAGSGIWYAVRAATGYEVGIIAVAVGFMVGAAVRKGSNGRGGWKYQALAMFLTYASIASAYVPDIVRELRKMHEAQVATTAVNAGEATKAESDRPSLGGFVIAWAFVFGLAFAAPFLGGFENILGIVIIGIGVYEAWKLNKRQVLQITGPHQVGAAEHG